MRIASDVWRYVLIDGNLGFLIDCKETLVEHKHLKEIIINTFEQNKRQENIQVKNVQILGTSHFGNYKEKVVEVMPRICIPDPLRLNR